MSTTMVLSAGVGDCWGTPAGFFYQGTGTLFLGHDTGVGNTHLTRVWIPFTVNLPKGKLIASATLKFVASQDRSDTIDVQIGCEAADNPSTPNNAGDGDSGDVTIRPLTSAYTSYSPGAFTAGTEYSVGVTAAVQEILNRAGWASGNTMAIFIKSLSTGANDWRRLIASNEHATYTEPKLEIYITGFVPKVIFC